MLDLALGAEGIKLASARHAESRLETPLEVIDAGVNDLAIARGGLRADRVRSLENDNGPARKRQSAGDRKADDACAVSRLRCL